MWAQVVAQEWLVYSITNSPLVLGQVTAVMAIPVWILGPWAGVVLDRFSRRHVLILSQSIQMVQAFVLAWLTFTHQIEVWHIMMLSGVRGIANAFDAPARQSFVVDMVGKEDLSNAIALNSTMFSLARFVGPAFGALILAVLGTAWAFAFNGITFLAILGSLLLMKMPASERRISTKSPVGDLLEGFQFIWEHKVITALMVVALAIALFGANFSTLIAVFAKDILSVGEVGFGMMKAANGLGSVLGALVVAYLSTHSGRGKQLNVLNLLFPATLILFAISRSYPVALITLAIVGVTFIPQLSLCNMLIQSNIPDEIRGRVMSVYTLMIFGANPLGALLSGAMAQVVGAPITILISAVAVIAISLITRIAVPQLRHIE